MSRRAVWGLIVVLLAGSFAAPVAAQDNTTIERAIAHIITYIQYKDDNNNTLKKEVTQGSGFLVDSAGYVVTAKHVVEKDIASDPLGAERWSEVSLGGHIPKMRAQQVGGCGVGNADICVLKVQRSAVAQHGNVPALKLLCTEPEPYAEIMSFGFIPGPNSVPGGTDGRVMGSDLSTDLKYQATVSMTGGMSGGPIMWKGYVIALNAGGLGPASTVVFIQPLKLGRLTLLNAGLQCLDALPSPEVAELQEPVIAQPEADFGAAVETPAALEAVPCGPAPRNFSVGVGPDHPPYSYALSRDVTTDAGCELVDYALNIGGNARVEAFNIENLQGLKGLRLNYSLRSEVAEERVLEVSLSLQQKSIPVPVETASLAPESDPQVDELIALDSDPAISLPTFSGGGGGGGSDSFGGGGGGFAGSLGSLMESVEDSFDSVAASASHPDWPASGTGPSGDESQVIEPGDVWTLDEDPGPPPTASADWDPCPSKEVVIDRTLPPLMGQVQQGSFTERVESDPDCVVTGVAFDKPFISAPEQAYSARATDDGSGAVIQYQFSSTDAEAGRLVVRARILQGRQLPTGIGIDYSNVPKFDAGYDSPGVDGAFGGGFLKQ